jgi:DHA3 family macrolide efflux protein-like MFS transporter
LGEERTRRGLLRNRNYAILLSGQLVSQMGNSFYPLAIYWYTYSLTRSSVDLGYLTTVISLTALVSMLTGVLVDRWDRRKTMLWSDVTRALLAGGLALLAALGTLQLPVMFAFALLLGLVGNLFAPAQMSLLPNVVGMEDLGAASGFNQGASAGAGLVGTSVGGFLLGIFGSASLLALDALSFVVSFVSIGLLRLPKTATLPRRDAQPGARPGKFLSELGEGLQFVYGNGFFRRVVVIAALVNFAFMPLNVLDVVWVRDVLHLGAFAYGLFGAAATVGIIAGSILAGPMMQRLDPGRLMIGSLGLSALAFAAFSQLPYFLPDIVALIILGVGLGIVNPVAQTLFQRATPQYMMGRAVGALMGTAQMASPLGALVGGVLASTLPLSTVFLGGAGLMLATLLLGVRLPQPPEFSRESDTTSVLP